MAFRSRRLAFGGTGTARTRRALGSFSQERPSPDAVGRGQYPRPPAPTPCRRRGEDELGQENGREALRTPTGSIRALRGGSTLGVGLLSAPATHPGGRLWAGSRRVGQDRSSKIRVTGAGDLGCLRPPKRTRVVISHPYTQPILAVPWREMLRSRTPETPTARCRAHSFPVTNYAGLSQASCKFTARRRKEGQALRTSPSSRVVLLSISVPAPTFRYFPTPCR